ncbi:hypothetical protein [Methylobacterium isbiliense]|jgi:hypothetical protein|uniref:Uncharacterized protein n=1 Tax=Methylobacterium isbiliense TaxID=315478 RepID=A0ABQ4S9Z8_9HYPH|nr:hypothetical protein [Methylobacterium isbiliense]MDN3625577.1 hypothetical protein [Methylobacterium isbiliense]GJE00012.1 hypothetical protein GMJLKIPL_1930 [Methylobacterium isbiliense]
MARELTESGPSGLQRGRGGSTSLPAALLHAWRLRRVRWAMAALRRRLEVYERAYGRAPPVLPGEEA